METEVKIRQALGLAAIVAVAATALLGTGSALAAESETTLCKQEGTECAPSNIYTRETAINAEAAAPIVIPTTLATVTCSESQLTGQTEANSREPLPIVFSAWKLKKCATPKQSENCTMTTEEVGKDGSLQRTTGNDGTLTWNGGATVQKWHLNCTKVPLIGTIDCKYSFEPSATLKGGNPAQLTVPKTTLVHYGGTSCPKESSLEGTYSLTSPKPAYVAWIKKPIEDEKEGTRLCSASESPCSGENSYPQGTVVESEAEKITIKTSSELGSITCTGSSLAFETKASMGTSSSPYGELPIELTTFLPGKCEYGGESCSVTTTYPEPAGTLLWNGALEWPNGGPRSGPFGGELKQVWVFKCGKPLGSTLTCGMYGGLQYEELTGSDESEGFGKSAGISFAELELGHVLVEGKNECPSITRFTGLYYVASQIPLYVTN
jgi:hypothetical protein